MFQTAGRATSTSRYEISPKSPQDFDFEASGWKERLEEDKEIRHCFHVVLVCFVHF